MAPEVFIIIKLFAVLTIYCIVFCPILCWAITGSMPVKQPPSMGAVKGQLPRLI